MSAPGGWPPPSGPGHPAYPASRPLPAPAPALQDDTDAAEPLEYHVLLRRGRQPAWGWSLLGVPLVGIGVFVLAQVVLAIPFLLYFAMQGENLEEALGSLVDFSDPRPAALAYLNLSLASAIPIVWLVVRLLHGLKPGWTTSVRPRMHWGYFAVCLVLSCIALFATVVVGNLLPSAGAGAEPTGELNEWTTQLRDFTLVVLLLTPLQAAGEEYLFRGYLAQAVGSIADGPLGRMASRALAVLVPSLLFALAHGSQSAPIFIDRLSFGLVAGVLVLLTGGLEAGIAMHVLNNFVAFGLAIAFGDMGEALTPTGGTWWMLPTTLTQSLVYFALAWALARWMGLARAADPAVLARSRGLVYRSTSALPES